jgi:hypothetical protein
MNITALAAVAAAASGQSPTPVQPGAAQVARFEQQLQAPAQFYQAPTPDSGAVSGNWRVMVQQAAQIDRQYQTESAALDKPDDGESSMSPERSRDDTSRTVKLQVHDLSVAAHMSLTMMNISLVANAERLAGENVRSLYQLS